MYLPSGDNSIDVLFAPSLLNSLVSLVLVSVIHRSLPFSKLVRYKSFSPSFDKIQSEAADVLIVRRALRSVNPFQSIAIAFLSFSSDLGDGDEFALGPPLAALAFSSASFLSLSSCSFNRANSSLDNLDRSHAAFVKYMANTSPETDPPPCDKAPSRVDPQIIALPSITHFGEKSS